MIKSWLSDKFLIKYSTVIKEYFPEQNTVKIFVRILHQNSILKKSGLIPVYKKAVMQLATYLYMRDRDTRVLAAETLLNLFDGFYFKVTIFLCRQSRKILHRSFIMCLTPMGSQLTGGKGNCSLIWCSILF